MKRRAKTRGSAGGSVSAVKEVIRSRDIKPEVTTTLWGLAAGRCEFWGCNTALWKSPVTQERVNRAQRAHIYSFSSGGPRGHRGVSATRLNAVENLMLVCHGCHRKIDQHQDGGRYPAELLQQWKVEHERRVELVTGIDPAKKSTILLYGANIGKHSSPLSFAESAQALFPRMHPAEDKAIQLGMRNSSFNERSANFWAVEGENLRALFEQRVRERIKDGEVEHLSVFAIAPQPLLMLLGTLLIDITAADVFQRHREPQTWNWPERASRLKLSIERPARCDKAPALVLAMSAAVTDDRIERAVTGDVSIWRVTVPKPSTDLIKGRSHLATFRAAIRPLLDEIKERHGQTTPLHVFPAVGVSIAVEFGRVRMPKAHMPWHIYDQVNGLGGFTRAFTLSD